MGTRKCPHNLNRPHFAGVFSYECPRKCAAVSTHTHTHTHQTKNNIISMNYRHCYKILYNEQRKTRVLIGLEECLIRV